MRSVGAPISPNSTVLRLGQPRAERVILCLQRLGGGSELGAQHGSHPRGTLAPGGKDGSLVRVSGLTTSVESNFMRTYDSGWFKTTWLTVFAALCLLAAPAKAQLTVIDFENIPPTFTPVD